MKAVIRETEPLVLMGPGLILLNKPEKCGKKSPRSIVKSKAKCRTRWVDGRQIGR